MEVRRFQPHDLQELAIQEAQVFVRPTFADPKYGAALADTETGDAFTALADGRLIGCIGVIKPWSMRQQAWAILAQDIRPYFLQLHMQVRRWLKYHGQGRVEAAVDCGFAQGVRWAEMLGFEREGIMKSYTMEGRDCFLYARVQK